MLAAVAAKIGTFAAQRMVQIAAAGLLSGTVAGTAIVVGFNPFAARPPTGVVALLSCPGSGNVIAHVPVGQTLLVTARSIDGRWVEVYIGSPGLNRAWAPANDMHFQEIPDSLPVAGCVETAVSIESLAPLATFTPQATVLGTII